jgi:hypothetical protein
VTIDTRAAHQLQPSRSAGDHLEIVIVACSIQGRRRTGEGSPKRGDHSLVGSGLEILTGNTMLPRGWIE